jgi:predicted GNAT family acetyltransferase
MIEQLNNPVWSSLTSGNADLAIGTDKAKRYQPGISPFVAVAQNDLEHYKALKELVPNNETVAVFTTEQDLDPSPWVIANRIDGYQMMYEGPTPEAQSDLAVIKLNQQDVPAMLELTRLSPPGPFQEKTIEFGGYEGIFDGEQLVAMAGHRFHCGPYVEISAVCTHPDHTGKGYARTLINNQIRHLHEEGMFPFLHVRADNTRAINIYKQMGFIPRTDMIIYLLKSSRN